jgi:SAM-dependent methyltransferase
MMLAIAIAPQRTTLYGNLARFLAVPELLASPLAPRLRDWERSKLAGQDWLLLDLDDPTEEDLALLWRFGTVAGVYEYFLRPLDPLQEPFVPAEIVEARRYRGKTSELFTAVLLNLALFAGDFAERTGERLRILDPLSGGGTTLFTALVRGCDAVGIEREKEDFDTTDAYTQQFLRGVGIPYKRIEERVRGAGRRAVFTIGRRGATRTFVLILGDTYNAPDLLDGLPGGARFHAIITDLPYGIQHQGQVVRFLEDALPGWADALLPGGTMALAWEATSVRRPDATALVEANPGLRVITTPPYDALEHQVDRQIKRRDVLVIGKV